MESQYKNMLLSEAMKDDGLFADYINMAKYLVPKNVMEAKPLDDMPWGFVKDLQYEIRKDRLDNDKYIEIFETITGVKINKVMVVDFFYQLQWVMTKLGKLTKIEQKTLSSELTDNQINAGFEDLDKFGYKATTHALAGKDVLKHDAIEAIPYKKIFFVLLLEKTSNDIDKKYSEIIRKKKYFYKN